jgi:hypothetical protein
VPGCGVGRNCRPGQGWRGRRGAGRFGLHAPNCR